MTFTIADIKSYLRGDKGTTYKRGETYQGAFDRVIGKFGLTQTMTGGALISKILKTKAVYDVKTVNEEAAKHYYRMLKHVLFRIPEMKQMIDRRNCAVELQRILDQYLIDVRNHHAPPPPTMLPMPITLHMHGNVYFNHCTFHT